MSGDWLHITVPDGVPWRVEQHWGQTHIYLRVADNFERESVGAALLSLAVQAIREKSLAGVQAKEPT